MIKKQSLKIPKFVWIFLIMTAGIGMFFILTNKQKKNSTPMPQTSNEGYVIRNLSIEDKTTIAVEIADTPEKTTLGLSYRESLPENHGMLFIFPETHIPTFWMKGMNFPLDMIWIDENNIVVDITENVPQPSPGTPEYELPHYSPKVATKNVLEVNAGFVEKNGIEVGDTVKLSI